MTETSTEKGIRRIGFLLLPEFSMMAFFAAVEPLRIANRCSGRMLYAWSLCSEDGEPVAASKVMILLVDLRAAAVLQVPTASTESSSG